ncbi:uncharacterized protein PHALS_12087 [Plasmopara halstedii]|uniref:Uncharacterized protein n=1 Tax=Plasmopara halstedii TaxID=4781 RepID=A0A0P1ALA1_PLAHL|nr:uncharacterized protein PHALS_12087 [Plasmopara halstedii]CEG41758.1 hypothetical protein PHALS_12087 [Plasmopara halstedii]|eukprot:XP_024578127.1 hypothetical protein PHALS_12087 [Plasmopara halstedii]
MELVYRFLPLFLSKSVNEAFGDTKTGKMLYCCETCPAAQCSIWSGPNEMKKSAFKLPVKCILSTNQFGSALVSRTLCSSTPGNPSVWCRNHRANDYPP